MGKSTKHAARGPKPNPAKKREVRKVRAPANARKTRYLGEAKTDLHHGDKENTCFKINVQVKEDASTNANEYNNSNATHEVVGGRWAKFRGFVVEPPSDVQVVDGSKVLVRIIINGRKKVMEVPREEWFAVENLRELDSYDMLTFSEDLHGEEDKELLAYEQGTWTCPKCESQVKNDGSYCQKITNGQYCGGMPKAEILNWDSCAAIISHIANQSDSIRCGTCNVSNDRNLEKCRSCQCELWPSREESNAARPGLSEVQGESKNTHNGIVGNQNQQHGMSHFAGRGSGASTNLGSTAFSGGSLRGSQNIPGAITSNGFMFEGSAGPCSTSES